MVQESAFRGVIEFLGTLGVYDIILPFLLVFTIVFAILEKTKILGTEKIGSETVTKKNLNAIIAFAIGFLVIASTQLVQLISDVLANVVLMLVLIISFLLLVGAFRGDKELNFFEEFSGWKKFFVILVFIGVVAIFLNAMDWLKYIFAIFIYWEAEWAIAIIFFLVILGFIWYIIRDPPKEKTKKE
jgi:hypothetical protein